MAGRGPRSPPQRTWRGWPASAGLRRLADHGRPTSRMQWKRSQACSGMFWEAPQNDPAGRPHHPVHTTVPTCWGAGSRQATEVPLPAWRSFNQTTGRCLLTAGTQVPEVSFPSPSPGVSADALESHGHLG